jgi:DNA polymerase III subunit beta
MKFSAVSNELFKALSQIISVVPSKSTLPILENVLFELNANELSLTASDLEIAMSVRLPVSGMEDGRIAIPAKKLNETLRALPTTDVIIEADLASNKIVLKTQTAEYKMMGDNASNFPETESVSEEFSITLETSLMKSIVNITSFAVSTDDLRPSMKGVLFQWRNNEFHAVATDGHRLVRVKHEGALSEVELDGTREVIIPAKALNLALKAVNDGNVDVVFGATNVKFQTDEVLLVSRIIDERYPNYEGVIPMENDKVLEVNRNAIISAIKRCSIFSNAVTNQIRMSLSPENLQVSAEDVDFGGEANETLEASFEAEETLDIGFNAKYLEDALSHIDTDDVVFHFSSPTRAGLIQPKEQPKDMEVLMLVMPLRLNN